jgi:hypothetical protein
MILDKEADMIAMQYDRFFTAQNGFFQEPVIGLSHRQISIRHS